MADKTVNLKLKIVPAGETKKSLDALKKVSTNWDKVFGPNGDKPVRNVKRQVDYLTRSWEDLGKAIKLARENFKLGFESGSESMRGLTTFTRGIEGATRKVFNLKNAIAGSLVGGAAIYGIKKLFEEGGEQIRTRKRLQREFGTVGAASIQGNASRINFAAGIQDDEAARGLIPLAEQLDAIQEGAQFRGMKRPLSVMEADALKRKNLSFGANLLRRVSVMAPEVPTEDLGRMLGDALAGPEGIRSLVSELHLSKRSKTLSAANEKGQAFKALTPEERKRFGINKAGQYLEQGDLVNLLLERSGITDQAATDESKTFPHQLRQIKATLTDQLGDIGAGALDQLTAKLGQGATAAERLQNYLASTEGKKAIDGIKDAVVQIVDGVAKVAEDAPKIGAWLKEHKGLLAGIAGIYGVAKIAPTAAGLVKGASAVLGGVRGSTPATPLYVQQVGVGGGAPGGGLLGAGKKLLGVAAAGGVGSGLLLAGAGLAAGYIGGKAGIALNNRSQKASKFYSAEAGLLDKVTGGNYQKLEDSEVERNRAQLAAKAAAKDAKIKALEAAGMSHGAAVYAAEHPNAPINVTTNVVLDGRQIAQVVEKHMVRNVENRTARGAAPVSKE